MLGFSPLSSAPISDDGDQEHRLLFNDITTTPVVDSATVFTNQPLNFDDIVTGAPVIDAIGTPVSSNFVADDIICGTPVIDSISVVVVNPLVFDDIITTPVIDSASIAITHVLSATSLGPEVTNFTVTVADNYGDKFYIDGVSNPTLSLVRGQKYVFDVSSTTLDGHPLRFKDSSGNSYTTGVTVSGVAGQSGATVTILVASDAPSSLRYWCTVHGNSLGNTISVSSQVLDLQPQIDSIAVSVTSNLIFNEITSGTPQIDNLPFFQKHVLNFDDIITGAPIATVRFTWDVQELAPGNWIDLSLASGIWTDQIKNPENWSGINLSSGSWSDEAETGGSWQDVA